MADRFATMGLSLEASHTAYAASGTFGTDSDTPYGGAGGVQRAISELAAGDTLYVADAATPANNRPLGTLTKWTVANGAIFAPGDLMTKSPDDGSSARVACVYGNDVYGELIAGGITAPHTVTPDGGSTTTAVSAAAPSGWVIDGTYCAAGDGTNGPVRMRGRASDWMTPARVYVNCSEDVDCFTMLGVTGWDIEGFTADSAADYMVNLAATNYRCRLSRLTALLPGTQGVSDGTNLYQSLVENCTWFGCGNAGTYRISYRDSIMARCVYANCGTGDKRADGSIDCLYLDNATVGARIADVGCVVKGCSFDGNGVGLTFAGPYGAAVLDSRFTNNTTAINVESGDASEADFVLGCGFYGNGTDVDQTNGYVSVLDSVTLTGDGYVNPDEGDFSLSASAEGRRVAKVLDVPRYDEGDSGPYTMYTTTIYQAVGLTPTDTGGGPYDAPDEADVRDGVVYDDATGTPTEGTCAVPDPSDVLFGKAVDATTGMFLVPAEKDVRYGVAYGAAQEFAGTLEGGAALSRVRLGM